MRKTFAPKQCRAFVVRHDDPARAIMNQAKKFKAEMTVMRSRGRVGLNRLVLGSVTERTPRYARLRF